MGSFTEGRLSFSFRADTPDHVLAAFAALAEPIPDDAPTRPPRPLPEPVVEVDEEWCPDYEDMTGGDPDPHGDTPWLHDWAGWLSDAMGVQTQPSGALRWSPYAERWELRCVFSWKTDTRTSRKALRWIAPFVHQWSEEPELIGQLHYEYDPRPTLLWIHAGELVLEHLDPLHRWTQEPLRPLAAELVVVTGLPGSGKSTYVAGLAGEHPDWLICDDYQAGAVENDSRPTSSRYFGAAARALQEGRTVVVADLRYGVSEEWRALVRELTRLAPFTRVRTVSFAADLNACEANIRARASTPGSGRSAEQDLAILHDWALEYEERGEVLPVRST